VSARAAEALAVARTLAERLEAPREIGASALLALEVAEERGESFGDIASSAIEAGPRFAARASWFGRPLLANMDRACQVLAGAWDAPRALVERAFALRVAEDARTESAASDAERAALAASLPVEAARAAGLLGELAADRGEAEAARRHFERAVDHSTGRIRWILVDVHEGLARACDACGRRSEAEEARARATTLRSLLGGGS
jgi:hypothetical protein